MVSKNPFCAETMRMENNMNQNSSIFIKTKNIIGTLLLPIFVAFFVGVGLVRLVKNSGWGITLQKHGWGVAALACFVFSIASTIVLHFM